jgi:hypothetical protein
VPGRTGVTNLTGVQVSDFPLRLPRQFFLRMFEPKTNTLSFRAEKGPEASTHIDLMFGGVREMKVQPDLHDVTVDLIDGGYSLSTPEFPDGYVLAEKFHYAEDDVDDWDTFDALRIEEHDIKRVYHFRSPPSPMP